MNTVLKGTVRGLLALALLSLTGSALAQTTRNERLISARAGGVNYVEGDVKYRKPGEVNWQRASVKDDLKSGDEVRTGTDGRIEVLLNPGSYFRAGSGTEFELVDSSLDDLRLRLARGGAVVEATGYDGIALSIAVNTPQTRVLIVSGGVYRISVLASGVTEVAVVKGRAYVGEGQGSFLKGGKVARVDSAGRVELAKLDKKKQDELDLWSKERGRELAKLNDKFLRLKARVLLADADFDTMFGYSRYGHGVWFWDPRRHCYTFMPFFSGWGSAYGFSYGGLYHGGCGNCPGNYYDYNNGYYSGGYYGGGGHSGGGSDSGGGRNITRGEAVGGNKSRSGDVSPRPTMPSRSDPPSPPPSRSVDMPVRPEKTIQPR